MFKLLSITLAGVFLGAATVAVVSRKRPDLLENVEKKAKRFANKLKGLAIGKPQET
jgi:hypothetical protein